MDFFAHPTAIIDPDVEIGTGTRIWHFCHLMPGAVIGKDCTLGQNVFVGNGVRIGNGVKVQNNVSLYAGVVVEDLVFLGPSCVLTNVINPRAPFERKNEFRATRIRRGATIGANATLLCGITLGEWCFVGAGAVVTRDVPDYALIMGNPGRQTGWMSRGGHTLQFDSDQQAFCPTTGDHYRLDNGMVTCLNAS